LHTLFLNLPQNYRIICFYWVYANLLSQGQIPSTNPQNDIGMLTFYPKTKSL